MRIFELTLSGDVPAKKNRYRMGGGRLYQHEDVKAWADDVYFQIKSQLWKRASWEPVAHNLKLICDFYITRDRDLDNMCNSVFDALQSAGVYLNDKQIGKLEAAKFIRPKDAPHVDIWGERLI